MYDTLKPATGKVLELIQKTWQTDHCSVSDGVYPIFKLKGDYLLVDHTDGIGTKGHYHWDQRTFKNAALDALAMNLNDLAMAFADPIKLQNHIFLPKDDNDAIFEIIETLVEECLKRRIAMTGGETSIHNNMNGMDISITVTGVVRCIKDNRYKEGDFIVGIPSSGLHSNGFTRVHELFKFRPEFVIPTRIYSKELSEVRHCINMANHITGGAYTKLLPYAKDVDLVFDFKSPEIFHDLAKHCSSEEMYKTFNCGYGMVVSVPEEYLKYVLSKTEGCVIGKVEKGSGKVRIKSTFDGKVVEY